MPRAPSNIRLLQIVVQSVKETQRLVALGTDFSYMQAVFFLDFAVEQMLNILIDNFSPDIVYDREDVNWRTLWREASKAVKSENVMDKIPHHKELSKLHGVRNLVQHQGMTPHGLDITQLVDPVIRMASTCFDKCFDLSFENFRLWDVIQNSQLRQLLEQCEQALDNNLPLESLVGSIVSFKHITSEIGKVSENNYRPPRLPSLSTFSASSTRQSPNAWLEVKSLEQWISNTTTSLEQLHIDSILGSLGLSLAETQKFRKISGEVVVNEMANGNWRVSNHSTRTPKEFREYANFALGYLSTLTLRAQDVYPEALARVSFKELLDTQLQRWRSQP